MTRVVNLKCGQPYTRYIGRGSPYGNKYSHRPSKYPVVMVLTREEAIKRFEVDTRNDAELMARIKRELKGEVLGCYCKPEACHGDVLAAIAEEP